jgi:hypothetical protein
MPFPLRGETFYDIDGSFGERETMNKGLSLVFQIVSTLIGVAMLFFGCIWMLQGLNMAPPPFNGGFMIGDTTWTLYGAILAVFGAGQIWWSVTRQR